MQNNIIKNIYERVRYKITDSLLHNKTKYVIYFGCVVLGAIIGFLTGKELPYTSIINVDNKISAILYEGGGIFYALKGDILLFVLLYVICIVGLLIKPVAISLYPIVALLCFRYFRSATCLIVIGGVENILGAFLFYIVYYTIFLAVFSYTVIKCVTFCRQIHYFNNIFDYAKYIAPSYFSCVSVVIFYNVLVCLILSIFSL